MDRYISSIAGRLSLRTPQRDSLEILAHLTHLIPLNKERNLAQTLDAVKNAYPSVENFERDFPSLCFALATGVGKTRLMGAFIAYLHMAKGINHFFVMAPNLTIYDKLMADFTPSSPKYVFQGLTEFSLTPPVIITADNYEKGAGVRGTLKNPDIGKYAYTEGIHINIFNISKINAEVRGGNFPRIKRLSEYIGESYFDYLSNLDDLVLLMDESHRYRASAGVKAINELKPILGLELTATPQVESGKTSVPFQNVIYSYPLYKAMEDGYVKEPAVATRENFNAKNYDEDQLEQLKLEDGIRIHETVKTELKIYADNNEKPYVKPFMLVVAQDTTHAQHLLSFMKSDDFFDGRYKDHVITVHSAQRGEEKDETVARLLSVENPNEPTEIVIHVNMLKEGWDVTNLYTLVPLRAANSRTLVEQSLGRGLRLPFGKRTGVPAVDRLTIVAHDRFNEIIAEANDRKSIIRTGVVIGKDIALKPKKPLEIRSHIDAMVTGKPAAVAPEDFFEQSPVTQQKPTPIFLEDERPIAIFALEVIKEFEQLPHSRQLQDKTIQEKIIKRIEEKMTLAPPSLLDAITVKPSIPDVVSKVTEAYIKNTIDIPRIVMTPKAAKNYTFQPFILDTQGLGRFHPVEQKILIQQLRTAEREQLQSDPIFFEEARAEDHIVSVLIDFDDISYDDHSDILYDLAGQMVAYIRSYLTEADDVLNVLQYHRKELANVIHTQMKRHYQRGYTDYDVTIIRGFEHPKMSSVSYDSQEKARYFRYGVEDLSSIRGMVFDGFQKCLYPIQKFDSDTERKFATLLEDDASVLKWFKPTREDFKIYYTPERTYEPDFVVETTTHKLLCEPKMEKDMLTDEVKEKAQAAQKWCELASKHALDHGDKPWKYLLIPHTAIVASATLEGLTSRFGG